MKLLIEDYTYYETEDLFDLVLNCKNLKSPTEKVVYNFVSDISIQLSELYHQTKIKSINYSENFSSFFSVSHHFFSDKPAYRRNFTIQMAKEAKKRKPKLSFSIIKIQFFRKDLRQDYPQALAFCSPFRSLW